VQRIQVCGLYLRRDMYSPSGEERLGMVGPADDIPFADTGKKRICLFRLFNDPVI